MNCKVNHLFYNCNNFAAFFLVIYINVAYLYAKLIHMTMEERRKLAHETILDLIKNRHLEGKELAVILGISDRTFIYRKKDGRWKAAEVDIIFDKFIDVK